jgi:hypothetical protein
MATIAWPRQGSAQPAPPRSSSSASSASAQSSGFGFGARALGMGGAFIAIADDASAASWNPAGIGQLTSPQVTIVGSANSASFSTSEINEIDTDTSDPGDPAIDKWQTSPVETRSASGGLDFLSYVQPFKLGRQRLVVQASYSRLGRGESSDSSATTKDFDNYSVVDPSNPDQYYLYSELTDRRRTTISGGLDILAAGVATSFADMVFVGASLEYWQGSLGVTRDIEQRYSYLTNDDSGGLRYDTRSLAEHDYEYREIGAFAFSLGVLVKPIDWLSVGGVYRRGWKDHSPQSGTFSYTFVQADGWTEFGSGELLKPNPDIKWPDSWGVGMAVRPISVVTLSCDVTLTRFDNTYSTVPDTSPARFPSGQRIDQNDQTAIRAGVEYLFSMGSVIVPIRAGFYSVPTPSPLLGSLDADPKARFTGITAGLGVVLPLDGDRKLLLDVAGVSEEISSSYITGPTSYSDTGTFTLSGDARSRNTRVIGSMIVYF